MGRVKYSQFEHLIDIDALEDAIGFDVLYEDNRGNDVGYCLWPENHSHGDTTGKFAIHREKRVYNCYVCGGGSLLSLVMELYGYDSETAEDYLRQFAGDQRQDTEFLDDFLSAFAQDTERRVELLPYFNPRVLDKWEFAYEYGESIGLNRLAIEAYEIRYAPELTKPAPKNGKFASEDTYVGPAVIWPHYWGGRLVGWQNRWLDENRPKWVGKWTNTVDFPKESTLYNYDLAIKNSTKFEPHILVFESAKSTVKAVQLGYDAVGTFGSNINEAQLRLLRRFQHGVILGPDNDSGGASWLVALRDYLKYYIPVHALAPVEGEKADFADLSDDDARYHIANNTVDVTTPHL